MVSLNRNRTLKRHIVIISEILTFWIQCASTNYHKLYLNTEYTNYENHNKGIPTCNSNEQFPRHISTINIFPEASNETKPCFCELLHSNVTTDWVWNYNYYGHHQEAEKFLEGSPRRLAGCGPVHFSIVDNKVHIMYSEAVAGVSRLTVVDRDLPIRITTDPTVMNVTLQCQGTKFGFITHECHTADIITTPAVSTPSSVMMVSPSDPSNQLTIILISVLVPSVLLAAVVVMVIVCRRRCMNKDNGPVLSDTIEVKQAKGKNSHLKLHNYENVRQPAVVEVFDKPNGAGSKSQAANKLNHDYENVYTEDARKNIAIVDSNDDPLYSKVIVR